MSLKVWQIPGEAFRYLVESRSDPDHPNLVDLSFRGGWGRCMCKHWECCIWPIIRDGHTKEEPEKPVEPLTKETTCLHVRAAAAYYLKERLPEDVRAHKQGGDLNESLS